MAPTISFSEVCQNFPTVELLYVNGIFQSDWTYVFYPSIILEKGDVHSNDIDKAMIDILKQARKIGLDKALSVYNQNEEYNHEN